MVGGVGKAPVLEALLDGEVMNEMPGAVNPSNKPEAPIT
jgi:hypothetical protein